MEPAKEFRIALTADDFEKALSFYRDAAGLPVLQEWPSAEGRGVVLGIRHATLEILDKAHAAWVDRMEVGKRVSGPVRFVLQFDDLDQALKSAQASGVRLVNGPIETPWKDVNARLVGPGGLQMTFFAPPRA